MTQETRKDPRAKVLTMTVRYKSATLDEFIEHHSHDVSRGGMFIKTPSPFPPGTLLKFEVKIAGEQRVMQGVGRVVWKRESSEVSDARPAGMGVKFIKIDDESRKVIDQLVAARGDSASTFEQGGSEAPTRVAVPAPREISTQVVAPSLAAREVPPTSNKPRKATMLGLGGMQGEPESTQSVAAEAFFPPAEADKPQPPPEDRTVMKQAAELLKDALREAGGSLDEVGAEVSTKGPQTEPPVVTAGAEVSVGTLPPSALSSEKPAAPSEKPVAAERSVIVNARPREEDTQPRRQSPPAGASVAPRRASEAPRRASEPPRSRSQALKDSSGVSDSGGSGRLVLAVVAVAAAGLVVYFLSKPKAEAPSTPEPPVPAAEAPPVVEPPAAPTPEPTAAPAEAPSAAASGAPAPSAAAPEIASATPPSATAPAPTPAPKPFAPRPFVKKPVAPKPVPEKPAEDAPAAQAPAADAPPAEPAPQAAEAPEAPKAAEAPKAPAAPKAEEPGDNPY